MSILIVDDSEFIHPQLKVFLAAGGHTDLVFTSSAAQAFDILGMNEPGQPRQQIDLVLMDVVMPDMDGITATKRIKSDPTYAELPVIIVTADASQETLRSAFAAGASDYIPKPLNKVELLTRVDAVLRLKEETNRRQQNERKLELLNQNLKEAFERIAREMDLVAKLQAKLLPSRSPRLPGIRLETLYRPSGRASGDYFDFFQTGPETIRLVIADVSGHGAQAAFIMAIVRTLFHASVSTSMSLEATMELVNTHLCETIGQESDFVTIFAADLNLADGEMRYINAGHCPCLLLNDGAQAEPLHSMHPPAGFVDAQYQARTISLKDKGQLFLFTDGLYEWQPEPGRVFGLEPFLLICEELLPRSENFLDEVEQRLRTLTGRKPDFSDDLTAVLASWDMAHFRAGAAG
ncbi:MAG: SpoIIE family protein phosphatase [Proteobacteria bacterium]|nr:SpoIIE family protein phosphatase [Pseudomonadota bacterium]MBU1611260.1 SpoIIE family protein phosphatase [Pseudomonadota bacterium]